MSQVITISTSANDSEIVLKRFLEEWRAVGSHVPIEQGYALTAHSGEQGLVTVEAEGLSFQGAFSDDGIELIVSLAEALDTELLLEGEPLEINPPQPKWHDFGWLEKTSGLMLVPVILLMTLLLIIALPVLLVVMLARLLFVLFKIGK